MIEILVVGLVAYRIWRILGADTLTQPIRDRMGGWPLELVECVWCSGTWIALAVTLIGAAMGLVALPVVVVWLAASTIVGAIGSVI